MWRPRSMESPSTPKKLTGRVPTKTFREWSLTWGTPLAMASSAVGDAGPRVPGHRRVAVAAPGESVRAAIACVSTPVSHP